MKMASRSRFSSAPWRCNNGESDPYPMKRNSICHIILKSSSNSRTHRPPASTPSTRPKQLEQEGPFRVS